MSTTSPTTVSESETIYASKNKSFKSLAVMVRGLRDASGSQLLDFSLSPWKNMNFRQTKPNLDDYKDEIVRRHKITNSADSPIAPRPRHWNSSKILEWLDDNPIKKEEDVTFLKETLQKIMDHVNAAALARQSEDEATSKDWRGKLPYLRLIHCFIDDDDTIRRAFLRRHDFDKSRSSIDNRRSGVSSSSSRSKSVWQLIAEKWNDKEFAPTTESFTDTHSELVSETIPHSRISHMMVATPEKCQRKFNTLRHALKSVIENWEQSGQGDGDFLESNNNNNGDMENAKNTFLFGSFEGRPDVALASRHAFLNGNPTYLLYLWEQLNKHNLLESFFQQSRKSCDAGNGANGANNVRVPLTIGNDSMGSEESSSDAQSESVDNHLIALTNSIKMYTEAMKKSASEELCVKEKRNLKRDIDQLKKEKRETKIEILKYQKLVDVYTETLKEIEEETEKKAQQLESLENQDN